MNFSWRKCCVVRKIEKYEHLETRIGDKNVGRSKNFHNKIKVNKTEQYITAQFTNYTAISNATKRRNSNADMER